MKTNKQKYKFQYVGNQFGGNADQKTVDIVDFINNLNLDTTDRELLDVLDNKTYCDKTLGQGAFGYVYAPNVSTSMQVTTSSNKKITMNVVVKKAHENRNLFVKNIDDHMYIYGDMNITLEAIILSYINKLWHKKLSPHLPFMVGYSTCSRNNLFVDQIITERHGLLDNVEVDVGGHDGWGIFWGASDETIFNSSLSTLFDFIKYLLIAKNEKNETVLPNGKKVNIVKLIDYLCISYLHTHNLLHKNNIIISDMHFQNVFVHWLNKDSYLDDQYIGDAKYVYYKFGKKIIKIETFGILLKIGDVGLSIVVPNEHVTILGQAREPEKYLYQLGQITKPNYFVFRFFAGFKYSLPFSIYKKTVAYKIFSTYPYNEFVGEISFTNTLLENLSTPNELLEFYEKYHVSEIDKQKNTFVVQEY